MTGEALLAQGLRRRHGTLALTAMLLRGLGAPGLWAMVHTWALSTS
jgi:hypothetical protein